MRRLISGRAYFLVALELLSFGLILLVAQTPREKTPRPKSNIKMVTSSSWLTTEVVPS